MGNSLSITRRFVADIIDIIVGLLLAWVVYFLLFKTFGPIVADSGYYFGTINKPFSEVTSNSFMNQAAFRSGEIWTIISFVLGFSLTQLFAEFKMSSSVGIKIMGGVCVDDSNNPISRGDAIKRFFVRIFYLPIAFCSLTHLMDIRPVFAVLIIFIIAFVILMREKINVIEALTSTKTIERNIEKKERA